MERRKPTRLPGRARYKCEAVKLSWTGTAPNELRQPSPCASAWKRRAPNGDAALNATTHQWQFPVPASL